MSQTHVAFLVFIWIAVIVTFKAEKYYVKSLREAHHENGEDCSESCQVLHHHPVDHGHHGSDLTVGEVRLDMISLSNNLSHELDATTEEEEIEAVTEHADDGEDVLDISEAEQPGGDHEDHGEAANQEDHPERRGQVKIFTNYNGNVLLLYPTKTLNLGSNCRDILSFLTLYAHKRRSIAVIILVEY